MTRITAIEGIGARYAEKLTNAGVTTVETLLAVAGREAGRARLAAQIGVTPQQVLEWVNRADLMRIKGIGSEFADLLESAGVDSVVELAQRNAANLLEALLEVNAARQLTQRTPAIRQVRRWIQDAKELPRAVWH